MIRLQPNRPSLPLTQQLGISLVPGDLPPWTLDLHTGALGGTAAGNCWTRQAAEERQANAQAAGIDCYIRCWHAGEVGHFVIRRDDYSRVLSGDERDEVDRLHLGNENSRLRKTLERHLGREVDDKEFAERYARAWLEYDRAQRRNRQRLDGPLSDQEWHAHRNDHLDYQPGNSKSSLFARLLAGEQALDYAPPCLSSYPWYSACESDAALSISDVAFQGERANAMTLGAHLRAARDVDADLPVVQIGGALWNILGKDKDATIVSYGAWRAAGWRWSLVCSERESEDIQGSDGAPLRTGADLLEDCALRIADLAMQVRNLAAAQSIVAIAAPSVRHGRDIGGLIVMQSAAAMLAQRREQGLSPQLSGAEREALVSAEFQARLLPDAIYGGQYRVREDDVIVRREWTLRCIQRGPPVPVESVNPPPPAAVMDL